MKRSTFSKIVIATIVALLFTVLFLRELALEKEFNNAKAYIEALENDFPEFIDTTSGTDAYSNYYY